ncbi:MAG: hypothetical protein AB7O67_23520 [Vicinamibacterales bacterium]
MNTAHTERVKGTRAVAERWAQAHQRFVEFAMEHAGLTRDEANAAAGYMVKIKVVKLDPIGGQFHAKHGLYLEPDVLRRAAKLGA